MSSEAINSFAGTSFQEFFAGVDSIGKLHYMHAALQSSYIKK